MGRVTADCQVRPGVGPGVEYLDVITRKKGRPVGGPGAAVCPGTEGRPVIGPGVKGRPGAGPGAVVCPVVSPVAVVCPVAGPVGGQAVGASPVHLLRAGNMFTNVV